MKCAEASPRLKAYYAAPLFNDMERTFNEGLVKRMEEYLEVFLPQRDGGLMMQLVKQGIAPAVAEKAVFQKDLEAMLKADMIVAILDGANVDEGVAFEIGYMYALDKYLIGLQTDMRRVLPTGNNPMIAASLNLVCTSTADLLDAIRDYCSGSPKECNKPVGRLARQDRVGAKIT
jgi:nucleoside 2-deoxyribosyltransferase